MEELELITEEQNEEGKLNTGVLALITLGSLAIGSTCYKVMEKRKKDIEIERDEVRGIIVKAFKQEVIDESEFDKLYTLLMSRQFKKEKVAILNTIAMAYETEEE